MFDKNDKILSAMRILLNVVTWILIIGGVISGTVLCCMNDGDGYIIGLPLLFCIPVFALLMWASGRLVLNFLCDVKLIRNKLYGEGIENFKAFLEYRQPQAEESTSGPQYNEVDDKSKSTDEMVEKLVKLKNLLDKGAITQEEFDAEKANLLKF